MAFSAILIAIAVCISQTPSANCQTTSPWLDPFVTGQRENPGARIHVNNKTLDAVHSFAAEKIAEALRSVVISEFELNIGTGNLLIKPPRITEVKFAKSEYQLMPPNQILSRFLGGKLIASGIWQFKKHGASTPISGIYKATITNMEVNATIQLSRTYQGNPMAQVVECKANLSQHLIELEGAPDLKKVENCKTPVCLKISAYFEGAVCKMVESFVKDVINFQLQNFGQNERWGFIFGGRTTGKANVPYHVDYTLLPNEPEVTEYDIRAGLAGKFVWRGGSVVPFHPTPLNWVDRNRMVSFVMGDYTFNTLFHQAHVAGYKFSSADLLPLSSDLRQLLRLNCDGTTTATTPKTRRGGARKEQPATKSLSGPQCLGQLFENFTSFGPYSSEDMGDVVYRSNQKPNAVYIQSVKAGYFDGSNGTLEILGPAAKDGSRKVLARADVRLLRGDFMPKLNGANITGSVKINSIQLTQAAPQNRMITDEWLEKLAHFFSPMATQSINGFFDQYAQFPIPLPEAYSCESPAFNVSHRTIQVDCDVKEGKGKGWVCYWVDKWCCGGYWG